MVDLIERDAVLSEITRCKDYAHKTFARSAADKKQKNFYEHTAYCEGVFDAWEDAETLISRIPAVNRWIPCSEMMPDNGVAVLVYTGENNFKVWLAEYSKYMEVWTLAGNYVPIKKNNVSYWMPIPEPPEKE